MNEAETRAEHIAPALAAAGSGWSWLVRSDSGGVRASWVRWNTEVHVVAVVDDKRDAIAALCRAHGVARMYVFGSALRDDYRPGVSDIDLLVEFELMDGHAKAHAYFDLLDELRDLLGVEVDLVMTGAVKNRYIARDIEQTKQVLYAA